ncbi:MAPEG family protein [Marinomonas sp. 2405UD66-6]|uniref:MAPEG family protein n=1 Tax=Marinomonas sp. 2405UD66-6 TaxID=3391834 RepID=UPI0039C9DE4E
MNDLMLYPMFLMVVLTFIIACITLKARFDSVKNKTVKTKFYSLMDGQEVPDIITKTTRNFNNQFEVPVLFYVVCSLYIFWGINSYFALIVAWLFVVLRVVHSYIHLTYNHVFHRMITFWLSLLCVMTLWVNLLLQKV